MRHIDLPPAAASISAISGLYFTEPTSGCLLLVVQADAQNNRGVAICAQGVTAEGWNMLHLAVAATSDAEAIATAINDALAGATVQLALPPAKPLQIVAVADGAASLPACIAVLQSHRQSTLPIIGGIVTVDAFAPAPASTTHSISDIAAELAEIDGLATVVAARSSSIEARRDGISYHQRLQAHGRETHFVVLAEDGATLLEHLANARGPLGREIGFLIDPVHSRNDT